LLTLTFWRLPGQTLLWRELQNTGHFLLSGLLAVLVLCSLRAAFAAAREHPLHSYLAAGSISLLCGIAVECVQLFSGRDADAVDVIRDVAGILVALGLCAGFDPWPGWLRQAPWRIPLRYLLPGLAAVLALASSYPLVSLAWAYHQRAQAFPVIFDPAANWSHPFIRLQHATLENAGKDPACRATANAGRVGLRLERVRYAGISIIEPMPDWRGHERLALEVYSPQPVPLELTLRIHDARHDQAFTDRFNRRLTLAPGENRIHIPLLEVREAPAGRRMDMAHIAGIMLISSRATGPLTVCPGPLRLE
jgi:hypothetical protein